MFTNNGLCDRGEAHHRGGVRKASVFRVDTCCFVVCQSRARGTVATQFLPFFVCAPSAQRMAKTGPYPLDDLTLLSVVRRPRHAKPILEGVFIDPAKNPTFRL